MKKNLKIGVMGLGMVGDPIRRWFEEVLKYKRGKNLFCYDADPKKGYSDDINKADIIFVAVPTPSNPDGSCNVSIVDSALDSIKDGKIVVIKSTVVPGTVEVLQKKHPKKKIIFNPEFLTEAQAWMDFLNPDRQIVAPTSKSFRDAYDVLPLLPKKNFARPGANDNPKKIINATEAELGKYASNIFGYIKVIFGNIMADACEAIFLKLKQEKIPARVNYDNVREIVSTDLRIGPYWLNVEHGNYCGAGGYCFPKDMDAFIGFGEELIKFLKKAPKKLKIEQGLALSLEKGIGVLKAVRDYNKQLLKWQGLTMEDVKKHDKEIMTRKRKSIRSHLKNNLKSLKK